jgi:hypothetical protein
LRTATEQEAAAKRSEAEAKAREAEAKQREAEAKRSEEEAKVREADAKARAAEASEREAEARAKEDELQAAKAELESALAELKAQEDAFNGRTAELQRLSEEGSVVQKNKAKNELAQHLSSDPLPLRRAKITQEAAVKKADRAAQAANQAANQGMRSPLCYLLFIGCWSNTPADVSPYLATATSLCCSCCRRGVSQPGVAGSGQRRTGRQAGVAGEGQR